MSGQNQDDNQLNEGLPEGEKLTSGGEDPDYSFMKETVRKRPVKLRKVIARVLAVASLACLFGAVAGFVFMSVTGTRLSADSGSHISIGRDEESSPEERNSRNSGSGSRGSGNAESRSESTDTGTASAADPSSSENSSDSDRSDSGNAADPSGTSAGIAENGGEDSDAEANGTAEDQGDAEYSGEAGTDGKAGNSSGSDGTSEESGDAEEHGTGSDAHLTESEIQEAEQGALEEYLYIHAAMKNISEEADKSIVQVTGITDTEDWFSNTETARRSVSGLIIAETENRVLIFTYGEYLLDSGSVVVTFPDGSICQAEGVKTDPVTGLGVIAVDADQMTGTQEDAWEVAELGNSYDVHTGDSVIAIGSPLGYSESVVYGEVTSVDGSVSVTDGEYSLITTNCLGNSSGSGVLINLDGEVIGFLDQSYAEDRSSVVTAIPISLLKPLIEKLSNNEALGYVGITGETIPDELMTDGNMPKGIYVTSVDPDSPALEAGLLPGDILQTFGDSEVTDMWQVHSRILNSRPGDRIHVTVMRSGADGYVEFDFTVTIGELS